MATPLTSVLSNPEEALTASMALMPIVLMVVGMILKGMPFVREWYIPVVLWVIAVTVGVVFDTAAEFWHSIANGLIQGSIATLAAILYWKGLKNLLKEERNGK
jgi:uncharacterized membrane protein